MSTHAFEPVNEGSPTCGVCGTDRRSSEHVARRPRVARPRLTPAVMQGLVTLAAHAGAGGPDDLEIDVSTAEGRRAWADVERAIRWVINSQIPE